MMRDKAIALRIQGFTYKAIGKELGVCTQYAHRLAKDVVPSVKSYRKHRFYHERFNKFFYDCRLCLKKNPEHVNK